MGVDFDMEQFIDEVEKRPALYDAHSNQSDKMRCWSEIGAILYPRQWPTLASWDKKTKMKLLIKKWKSLRDNFVREYKYAVLAENGEAAPRNKKTYIFYDRLQFLQPYVRSRATMTRMENVVCEIGLKNPLENEMEDHRDASDDPLNLQEETFFEELDVKPDIAELNQSQSITAEELVEGTTFLAIPSPRRSSSSLLAAALKSKRTAVRGRRTAIKRRFDSAPRRIEDDDDDDVYGHRAFMMSYIPILNSMPLHAAMQARMQVSQIISFAFAENSAAATGTPTSITTENSGII